MTTIFTKEKINIERQFEVDLARVFAIVTMVLVHLFERLDWETIMLPTVTTVIGFLGGPMSAPVFMTAMGIGMTYSKNQEITVFAVRGKELIKQGYILNFWRAGLLALVAYGISNDDVWLKRMVEHMVVIDILQFAGIAFLVVALLKRLQAKPWQMLILAILMQATTTIVNPIAEGQLLFASVIGYFFYQPNVSYFPLFSWFIYPVAGYCFAMILQRVIDKNKFYIGVFSVCAVLFTVFTAILPTDVVFAIFMDKEYYSQGLIRSSWILLVCGMFYSLMYFVSLGIGESQMRRLIKFMSSKVNDIYLCQWILIAWLCQFVLVNMKRTPLSFGVYFVCILVLSVLLVYIRELMAKQLKKRIKI